MATETQSKASNSSDESKAPEEPRFAHEDLLENARLLIGHSRHVLASALTLTNKNTLTVAEAKKLVERFLSRKVETAGGSK